MLLFTPLLRLSDDGNADQYFQCGRMNIILNLFRCRRDGIAHNPDNCGCLLPDVCFSSLFHYEHGMTRNMNSWSSLRAPNGNRYTSPDDGGQTGKTGRDPALHRTSLL